MKKSGQKTKVVGQQHQGGNKTLAQTKPNGGKGRKIAVKESEKQRRKRIYAQRAEEERASRPASQASYVPGEQSCRCGNCISCILARDRKEQARRAEQRWNGW